jgi:hypothetical protein
MMAAAHFWGETVHVGEVTHGTAPIAALFHAIDNIIITLTISCLIALPLHIT